MANHKKNINFYKIFEKSLDNLIQNASITYERGEKEGGRRIELSYK